MLSLNELRNLVGESKIEAKKQANKVAEIRLDGFVGADYYDGITAKGFSDTLNGLGRVDHLTVILNSYGGSVSEGFSVYNALIRHPSSVKRIIAETALSIAGVILQAGTERIVYPTSWLMLHPVQAFAFGNVRDMETVIGVMRRTEDDIVNLYANKTKQTSQAIKDMMAVETWLNGDDIMSNGFADKVIDVTGDVSNCWQKRDLLTKLYDRVPDNAVSQRASTPRMQRFIARNSGLFQLLGEHK